MVRNTNVDAFDYTVISGASADTTLKGGPGTIHAIDIWAVGAASSKIELFDGAAVGGTKIGDLDGTTVTRGPVLIEAYCKSSLHVKTTDSGGAMRITVYYL